MAEGIAPHSMVSEMLENNEEEAVIKSVAGTTYAGEYEPPLTWHGFPYPALIPEAAVETVSWKMAAVLVYILTPIHRSRLPLFQPL